MSREDDKIISLEQRQADRKAKQAAEARAAQRRRSLAEHGPGAVRAGRIIGRFVGILVLLVGIASIGIWIFAKVT